MAIVQVKDRQYLSRDSYSKGIVSSDTHAYNKRKEQIQRDENNRKATNQQTQTINSLRKELAELRGIVGKLLDN